MVLRPVPKLMSRTQPIDHHEAGHFAGSHDAVALLQALAGPTRIHFAGKDSSRCRVLVTLLHGNEPSGIKALHHLLRERFFPATDVYCYLVAIEAATLEPLFSHRQVPGKRDYNRCFSRPFDLDEQGRVCAALLQEITSLRPEAVVDMHNTSGEGPAFSVSARDDRRHVALASLFTDRMIVTGLKLGAIMETTTDSIPVITVECGGAFEATADRFADAGLRRFFAAESLYHPAPADYPMDVYYNPLRIEMPRHASLAYSDGPVPGCDITLKTEIEHHNFGRVTRDTLLGWVSESAMQAMTALDAASTNRFGELYRHENGALYPRFAQKMFMITGNPGIARSDCLWYVVPDSRG